MAVKLTEEEIQVIVKFLMSKYPERYFTVRLARVEAIKYGNSLHHGHRLLTRVGANGYS